MKFGILDRDSPEPKVYFINSNTYTIHGSFFAGIGASVTGDDGSGEIVLIQTMELMAHTLLTSHSEIPLILKMLKGHTNY